MGTEPTGQVCATCGSRLVAEKPPTKITQALASVIVALVGLFVSGFVWQVIAWSWGL